MHTCVNRETPWNTDGDAGTGNVVWVSVHGSEESWIPESMITVGLPRPAHWRYSSRPPPMSIWPANRPCFGLPAATAAPGTQQTIAASALAIANSPLRRPTVIGRSVRRVQALSAPTRDAQALITAREN